ncbi:L-2-hydroxyglutarate oxidase LhgO [Ferrimonas sediminum]|uniref:L-2-hydroxyglutarate oxidase LhgO n=1 Tax=Ferrimonas sediminum TaxID=718193 RepID=A0A1G9AM90_9GAMM|nr:NAD(P)/FAD-dependent oxidoreductase [Ferrimonas sediminum]SDK28418.1 L-2-hydroxyglutarate oxidase LhgO [Ferrimonas sediminum]
MERLDTLVVGAGVVGLAIARQLSMAGREVTIIEQEGAIGTGISSRNSEVIHAGLYNPNRWLKTTLCVRGRHLLYHYLEQRGLPHRRCGKLVVATDAQQLPQLLALFDQGQANGVTDLRLLNADQARELEPALRCHGALLSPSTGILDAHQLMLALLADAEAAGCDLALKQGMASARALETGFEVTLSDGYRIHCETLVLATGLNSISALRRITGIRQPRVQPAFAKGNYYRLTAASPFQRLIYPLPEPGGLGIHLTLDLDGHARFGPNVEWCQLPHSMRATPGLATPFCESIRRYWPDADAALLQPDYAGIRPKLCGPGEAAHDFAFWGPDQLGGANMVALGGIESPGLTSALAIAEHVQTLLTGS